MPSQEIPLIWTTRGNQPVADLAYAVRWEDSPEYLKMVETYTAKDGVVVKESAHVYAKRGMFAEPVVQSL